MNSRNVFNSILLMVLLSLPSVIYPQNTSLDWINKNAHELPSDSASSHHDLRFLSKIVKDKTIVGLGEASHGTHEFYFHKRRMIEYLVSQEGYRLIGLEFANSYIEPINNYIQTGRGDLKSMIKSMVLYNSDQIYLLCQWLHRFNQSRSLYDKVTILGFDDEEFWRDPLTRDEEMAKKFIRTQQLRSPKSILWSHNLHLAKDTTMAQYKGMGYHVKEEFGDHYYAIGFDTYSGSVNVINSGGIEVRQFTGTEDTLSDLFREARLEAFFVDFDQPDNPFLGSKNLITNIYSDWREPRLLPIVPGADFDGLVFIRTTTESKTLK
ncbi:erythromycin esterase family protein [Paradesertivirga mongoliensis]|uniref:Erythromycin esterase family protein n=1 Tax=Paradesertivirga mongoliensis TaxID=2100740 RepID=A0ABW4ZR06_9SPHI|nr:erythromycin esterase family protein [Pedobacter mongoliensis]